MNPANNTLNPIDRPNLHFFIAIGLIALTLVTTIWLSYSLNLWIDEMYTLSTVNRSPIEAAERALTFERQAPFYFMVAAAWHSISLDPAFMRALSALCVVWFLVIVYLLIKRWYGKSIPSFLLITLFLNPFLLWAGSEMRVYALALALSATLLFLFDRAFLDDTESRKARIGWQTAFTLLSVIAIYTQYYLAFYFLAFGVGLLLTARWQRLFAFSLMMILVVAVAAPLLVRIPEQTLSGGPTTSANDPILALLLDVYRRIENYIAFLRPLPRWSRYVLRTVLLVTSIYSFVAKPARKERLTSLRRARFLTAISLIAVSIVAWVSVHLLVGDISMSYQHTYFVFLPLFLLLAEIMWRLRRVHGLGVVGALSILLLISQITGYAISQTYMAKEGDAKRAAAIVSSPSAAEEPILVFPRELSMALQYYLDHPERVAFVPQHPLLDRYLLQDNIVRNISSVAHAIEKDGRLPKELWYYTNYAEGFGGHDFGRDIVEAYIFDKYAVSLDRQLYGARLYLLELKDG